MWHFIRRSRQSMISFSRNTFYIADCSDVAVLNTQSKKNCIFTFIYLSLLDGKFTVSVIFYWQLLLITVLVLSVLIITVIFTVSAANYCHLLCLLLSVLRFTVIYSPCTVGTANYCHLLSLSIASHEPWNCASGWIYKVSGLYIKIFFFKIISFKVHFLFLASLDNYNDTKHCMCI
jgi:hypothetical protein